MAAAYTDLFTEVGDPGTATTLSSPGYTSGVSTTITVGSTSGWPTATGVIFVIDEVSTVDGVEVRTDGTYNEYSGTVTNGTLISNVTWERGDGNRNYPAGATTRVYIGLANEWGNRMAQGMVVAHAQDGKLAATGGSLTSPKIITALNDTNDNELLKVTATGSAVNELTLANAATGGRPVLSGTGGDTNISPHMAGKGSGKAHVDGFMEIAFDFVASGGVWSGDSYASTLNASMTAMVCYINGRRISIAAVTARAFTASKDVYIDVLDNADGTGTLVYTEVTNNAASPALAANSLRIGIIVTGASAIASVASINQGQETKLLPIASSTPYAVTDSLGNLICPRDPNRKTLGYKQNIAGNQDTSGSTNTQITGLICPTILPTLRKVKVTLFVPYVFPQTAFDNYFFTIWSGSVGGTQLQEYSSTHLSTGGTRTGGVIVVYKGTFSGATTFYASFKNTNTGSAATRMVTSATSPAFLEAELA